MSTSKKTPLGYVVVHKESRVQYAVSPQNFNQKIHDKVRELKHGESPRSYAPKLKPKRATQDVAVVEETTPVLRTNAHEDK